MRSTPEFDGVWITPAGEIRPCDHANGRHHSHVAFDTFAPEVEPGENGEHDKYSLVIATDLAFEYGWIRLSTRQSQSLSVEWQTPISKPAKNGAIAYISALPETYYVYELEALGRFEQHDDLKAFIRALRALN